MNTLTTEYFNSQQNICQNTVNKHTDNKCALKINIHQYHAHCHHWCHHHHHHHYHHHHHHIIIIITTTTTIVISIVIEICEQHRKHNGQLTLVGMSSAGNNR